MTLNTDNIRLTKEFTEAFESLEFSERNVFISGKAGTGKSTFLEYFRKNTTKNIAVVAPTGVSALNVRGQTVHSFFGLDPRFIDVSKIGRRRNKKVYKQIDLLIIDEISMVRADLFDGLEKVLRVNGPVEGAPFGGIQICVIGDLFQLPPVITRTEEEIFKKFYESPFFFSSDSYKHADFQLIKFDEIFRQDDSEFINVLNRIRIGHKADSTLNFMNQRYDTAEEAPASTVTLCSTNALADGINERALASIDETSKKYKGKATAGFDLSAGRLPAPAILELKEGAQVMFTKNDTDKRWVNGTVGIVKELGAFSVEVDVLEGDKWKTYSVAKEKWSAVEYKFDEEKDALVETEKGSYTQYPLTLAWAITIHKSQGKTLDSAVIDLGRGAFAPGQLYVALSRCRHFDGIFLKKPINARDIRCDERILEFARDYAKKQKERLTVQ